MEGGQWQLYLRYSISAFHEAFPRSFNPSVASLGSLFPRSRQKNRTPRVYAAANRKREGFICCRAVARLIRAMSDACA